MKRTKSILFVLVLALMVFGMVSAASAAGYTDITGVTGAADISKLSALGIVNGYPDGTFKPGGDITRAEMAKIAVIMAGLNDSADFLKNSPTSFSDVAAGQWYTGYINVAASQGLVQGYPDGTFKPDAKVTAAEAVTIDCRLLGYDDRLPGDWPVDYLSKAGKLDITKDVVFNAAAPATRGIVAQFCSQTLDVALAVYDKDIEDFKNDPNKLTLLDENFESGLVIEDAIIENLDASNNKMKLVYKTWDKDGVLGSAKKIELAGNYEVYGAANVVQLIDRMADIYVSDDEAAYVDAKDYGMVVLKNDDYKTTVSAGTLKKIEVSDKSYDLVENYSVSNAAGADLVTNGTLVKQSADLVKLTLNDDGDVARVKLVNWGQAAVVDYVNEAKNVVRFKSKGTGTFGFDSTSYDLKDYDGGYYFVKNGAPASIKDLQENDLVYNYKRGVSLWFEANATKVEGILNSYKTTGTGANESVSKVTIGDTEYKVATNPEYSTDNGDEFETMDVIGIDSDLVDTNVTAYLNATGKVQLLITDEKADSNKIYGVVTEIIGNASTTDGIKDYIKVLKADGTVASYQIKTATKTALASAPVSDTDLFVEFTVDNDGKVDEFTILNTNGNLTDVDSDKNVYIGGKWYVVADDVKVFNLTNSVNDDDTDYAGTESFQDLYDYVDDANTLNGVIFNEDKGLIDYIVVPSGTSIGGGDYWMVLGKGRNTDGTYLQLERLDTKENKQVKSSVSVPNYSLADVTECDVIKYNTSAGDISTITMAYNYGGKASVASEVYDISAGSNRIKIGTDAVNAVWYTVDADTIVYDVTDEDAIAIEFADLGKGDRVASGQDKGVLQWIVKSDDK